MKTIFLTLLLLAASLSAKAQLALAWSYPSSLVTTDLVFVVVTNSALSGSPSNWPVASIVPATAPQSTNGAMYNYLFLIQATNYVQFFSCAASNFIGSSWATNAPYVPPMTVSPANFILNKLSVLTNGSPPMPPGLP